MTRHQYTPFTCLIGLHRNAIKEVVKGRFVQECKFCERSKSVALDCCHNWLIIKEVNQTFKNEPTKYGTRLSGNRSVYIMQCENCGDIINKVMRSGS